MSRAKIDPADIVERADLDHIEHNPDPEAGIDPAYSDAVEPFEPLNFDDDAFDENDGHEDDVDDFDFDTLSVDGDD